MSIFSLLFPVIFCTVFLSVGAELEELPLSGAAMAAQLAAQDRLPLKHKMLKVIVLSYWLF